MIFGFSWLIAMTIAMDKLYGIKVTWLIAITIATDKMYTSNLVDSDYNRNGQVGYKSIG